MRMSDEQFEKAVSMSEWCDDLRARDTAQREALARVEAERDRWIGHYNHLMEQHMPRTGDGCEKGWSRVVEGRELQAQLAEAVGLLNRANEDRSFSPKLERDVFSFLARNAQAEQQEAREPVMARPDHGVSMDEALSLTMNRYSGALDKLAVIEQQEAQGAQAGDERAAFESDAAFVGMNFSRAEAHPEYYESPFVNGAWEGWQARAALATQPAAGEPIAWADNIALGRIASGRSVVTLSNAETVEYSIPLFRAAPPAAAHGDEAVLDVLKTAYESGYQDGQDAPNAYSDEKVKHRIALSLLEEMMADATMRAQGDGHD